MTPIQPTRPRYDPGQSPWRDGTTPELLDGEALERLFGGAEGTRSFARSPTAHRAGLADRAGELATAG